MKQELYVTDKDGNIIDTIDSTDSYVKLSEGDRVIRKGALKYLNDTVDMKYRYIKVNPYSYGIICKKYSLMNTLIKYMGYMDNKLEYRNGKPVRMKDLPKLSGLSATTVKKQLKGLREDDVIRKVRDKNMRQTYIVINPFVAYIGRKIFLSLFEEFKLSVWRNYCEEYEK